MEQNTTEQPAQIDLDHYTDMTVGEILSRTRQHYAQTISQVSVNLRIRESYIEALETSDLDVLPGRVYAIGFVRAYAEYLGLDGDKIVYLYKVQSVGKKRRPDIQFKKPIFDSQTPNLIVVLSSLAAAVILLAYLSIYQTPKQFREDIPLVPDSLKKSTLISYDEPSEISDNEDLIGSKIDSILGKDTLSLLIESDSWIEIRDKDNKVIISQVLKKGNRYDIPNDSNQTMVTGNAGGVAVFNGKNRIGILGKANEVRRNISLTKEALLKE